MSNGFFAMMFRMKYIKRWGLMRSLYSENLSEHSMEVAIVSHSLCEIGNNLYGKNYNSERVALKALFHDAPEILTGDLPTPIKYYNDDTRNVYKTVEDAAILRFIDLIPPELADSYSSLFKYSDDEHKIIKAADKLCAYIKCLDEFNNCNKEFSKALESTKAAVDFIECEELDYFIKVFLPSFSEPLDSLK